MVVAWLDSGARDAATGVDVPLDNGTIRTRLHAATTLATANTLQRGVIAVALLADYRHAEQNKSAEFWGYKQRLTTNPTQSGIYGISLLKYRRRVGKYTTRQGRAALLECRTHLLQHLFDSYVIVGRKGIGGYLLVTTISVAVGVDIFVRHSAYDNRLCTLDKQ